MILTVTDIFHILYWIWPAHRLSTTILFRRKLSRGWSYYNKLVFLVLRGELRQFKISWAKPHVNTCIPEKICRRLINESTCFFQWTDLAFEFSVEREEISKWILLYYKLESCICFRDFGKKAIFMSLSLDWTIWNCSYINVVYRFSDMLTFVPNLQISTFRHTFFSRVLSFPSFAFLFPFFPFCWAFI